MKARLPKGTVFLWGSGNLAELADFFQGQGFPCRFIPPDRENDPMEELLSLAGEGLPQNGENGEQVLLFRGFSDGELNRVLAGLRRNGLGQGALKAVITPHNLSWTLAELIQELTREREAFREGTGGCHG